MPGGGWLPGHWLLALNNAGVVLAIVMVGSATAVNIVYSVRGLFSVLLVWLVGHWFTNEEQRLGGHVLQLRLAGAGLMVAAIVLVLIWPPAIMPPTGLSWQPHPAVHSPRVVKAAPGPEARKCRPVRAQ